MDFIDRATITIVVITVPEITITTNAINHPHHGISCSPPLRFLLAMFRHVARPGYVTTASAPARSR
jgi:hypothetical protein